MMKTTFFAFISFLLTIAGPVGFSYAQVSPKVEVYTEPSGFQYESFEGDLINARRYVLPNGLTVYLSNQNKEPRIQARVVVKTGSRNDPSDNTGLAHYLEHLLFKGTRNFGTLNYEAERPLLEEITRLYDAHKATLDSNKRKEIYRSIDSLSYLASQYAIANEYDKMMQAMGVDGVNAYTTTDETVYINDVPANQIEKWLYIESERFKEPVFRLFHTELETVYEEKNRSIDNDMRKCYEKLFYGLLPNHPYGTQTTLGSIEHLKNPSITAIEAYYNKYYVPGNMALILSGDFNPDSLIKVIHETFGSWQVQPNPVNTIYNFEPQLAYREVEVLGPSAEFVMFAYRLPGATQQNHLHAHLINEILYNGKAGLLDLNINLSQKVQSSYGFVYAMNDASFHVFGGVPRENQDLKEVRSLILAEIEKIKKGEFDEKMLQSVIDNYELSLMRSLRDNYSRCDILTEAFVRGQSWKSYQAHLLSMREIKKEDLVQFANTWFTDEYVTVFKRIGTENNPKITKPEISPVELNKGLESDFAKEQSNRPVERISPQFVNFADLKQMKTRSGLQLYYTPNQENELFSLYYVLDMGSLNDLKLAYAIELLPYLGTDLYSPEEINLKFYELAADFGVSAGNDKIYVYLNGLQKNLDAALQLFEHLIRNAKPNQKALDDLVSRTLKSRENQRKNSRAILQGAMLNYALYGKDNPFTYRLKSKELKALKAEELCKMIHQLFNYNHIAFYHGPLSLTAIGDKLDSAHSIPTQWKAAPPAKTFTYQTALKKNQVLYFDYDMVQTEVIWVRSAGLFDPKWVSTASFFNNYFDGGMGTVVFQEIREAKALAYSTYARFNIAQNPQYHNTVTAYIGTQSDKLEEAIPAMNELFNKLPSDSVAVEQAREALLSSLETVRVRDEALFFYYLHSQKMGRNFDINETIYNEIKSLGIEDLQRFQSQFFANKSFTYCVIGSQEKVSMKELEKLGKTRKLTLEELFGKD